MFVGRLRKFRSIACITAADDVADIIPTTSVERYDMIKRTLPWLQPNAAVGTAGPVSDDDGEIDRIYTTVCTNVFGLLIDRVGEADEFTL